MVDVAGVAAVGRGACQVLDRAMAAVAFAEMDDVAVAVVLVGVGPSPKARVILGQCPTFRSPKWGLMVKSP